MHDTIAPSDIDVLRNAGLSVSRSVSRELRAQGVAVAYLDGGLQAWIEHGESLD